MSRKENIDLNEKRMNCAIRSFALTANYVGLADGKFDEKEKIFVEPYLPNHKLGIIHLASGIWDGDKDMRLHKEVKINIKTLENNILSKSLRFGH